MAAAIDAGVGVLDLTTVLCPGGLCRAVVDGVVTYRDDDHLTATFAASLADEIGGALASFEITER